MLNSDRGSDDMWTGGATVKACLRALCADEDRDGENG